MSNKRYKIIHEYGVDFPKDSGKSTNASNETSSQVTEREFVPQYKHPPRRVSDLEYLDKNYSESETPAPDFEYVMFEYPSNGSTSPTCLLKIMTNYQEIVRRTEIGHSKIRENYVSMDEDGCANWSLFSLGIIDEWTLGHMVDVKKLVTENNKDENKIYKDAAATLNEIDNVFNSYTKSENTYVTIEILDLLLMSLSDPDTDFAIHVLVHYASGGGHTMVLIKSHNQLRLYDPSDADSKKRLQWSNYENERNIPFTDRETLAQSILSYCNAEDVVPSVRVTVCNEKSLTTMNTKQKGTKVGWDNFVEHGGKRKKTRRRRMKNKTKRTRRNRAKRNTIKKRKTYRRK